MERRKFIRSLTLGSGAIASAPLMGLPRLAEAKGKSFRKNAKDHELTGDVVIAGGGLGGFAAALAALRNGMRVIMTEETHWIGGQLTQQGVSCPDEHQWIEQFGATRSYRDLRTAIREYYRRHYPLTGRARSERYLNPGNGSVSRLCHEPRVSLAVLYELLAPYLGSRKLVLLLRHKITAADVEGDQVRALKARNQTTGDEIVLRGSCFIDATELGDLLPLTGTEFVTGAESKAETRELHAAERADPANQQAFTLCFAMDYVGGEDHLIDEPPRYDFWKDYVPQLTPPWSGKLLDLNYSSPHDLKPKKLGFDPTGAPTDHTLNLWNYRRIADPGNFASGTYSGGITIVNWPENDFLLGNLVGVSESDYKKTLRQAEELGLSLFYWLQTAAPRPDGKQGWRGLRLRGDILGTETGMAQYPYVRESRRIKAVFTVLEEHVGAENRALVAGKDAGRHAASFYDSVGVGSYHIDLHPSTAGNNYIDFNSLPFQIPLGALLPQRVENLLAANKNIGTTHITNGCYRLHPVEWNIGESAGMLAVYSLKKNIRPRGVREQRDTLKDFQVFIRSQGVETHWPESVSGQK